MKLRLGRREDDSVDSGRVSGPGDGVTWVTCIVLPVQVMRSLTLGSDSVSGLGCGWVVPGRGAGPDSSLF